MLHESCSNIVAQRPAARTELRLWRWQPLMLPVLLFLLPITLKFSASHCRLTLDKHVQNLW